MRGRVHTSQKTRFTQGFTLVELLVVIAIIAILAGLFIWARRIWRGTGASPVALLISCAIGGSLGHVLVPGLRRLVEGAPLALEALIARLARELGHSVEGRLKAVAELNTFAAGAARPLIAIVDTIAVRTE
mgnify:CR=1 FL=1